MNNWSPHAQRQVLREEYPTLDVQVNCGQLLVRAEPLQYLHLHPGNSLSDHRLRLDRWLTNNLR